jgi:hypothetical protein
VQAFSLQGCQIQHGDVQPIQTLALQHELFGVCLKAGPRFFNVFPGSFIQILNMTFITAGVNGKILGHREDPRLRVIEQAVLAQVSEESQEGFLCDVFRPSGIPRFSQKVSKHWDSKLFEEALHSFTQRHGA